MESLEQAKKAVFVIAVLIYLNGLPGELVFDDLPAIVENPDVRGVTPLKQLFLNDFWGSPLQSADSHKSYRPVTVLTFRLNYALGGTRGWTYHMINVILHGLVCALFVSVCHAIVPRTKVAFTAGNLFAVHPIHTEAVTGVVGRTELLSALFYLAAILTYIKGLRQDHSQDAQRPKFIPKASIFATAILASLSMLSKEQGLTALAVCAAYDTVCMCSLDARGFFSSILTILQSRAPRWMRSLLYRLVVLGLCTLGLVVARILLIAGGTATSFSESDNPTLFEPSWITRLLTYFYLPALNSWLLLCPASLCYDWSMDSVPRLTTFQDVRNLATLLLVAALAALSAVGFYHPTVKKQGDDEETNRQMSTRRRQAVAMALVLVLVPYLPASNLFFPVGFVVAERVLYLPSMGYCLLVALGLHLLHLRTIRKSEVDKESDCKTTTFWSWFGVSRLPFLICLTIHIVFTAKTLHRNVEWWNMESLGESGFRVNPANAKIHFTIANNFAQKGLRVCEDHYREAIRLRPHYTAAWINLGLVLLNMDRAKEGEQAYQMALSINPASANAHTNYGHLCRIQSRWDEAVQHYQLALQKRPMDPVLLYNVGLCLKALGNYSGAEIMWQRCVAYHPGHGDAWLDLGKLLATTKKDGKHLPKDRWTTGKRARKAEEALRTALRYKTADADIWLTLVQLLVFNDQLRESEALARQSISATGGQSAETHYWLGHVLQKQGLQAEAEKYYKQSLEINPKHERSKDALLHL